MELKDLIILTPTGLIDPALAIGACRAGARGVLDLEFAADAAAVAAAVDRLAHFASGGFGVALGPDGGWLLPDSARPTWVILSDGSPGGGVASWRERGAEVFVEATTLDEAVQGAEAGADGIILKGHEAGGRVGPDGAFILVQKWRQWADRRGGTVPPFWVRGGIGPNTAAACLAAGARGVVLDAQVLLARESPVADGLRQRLAGCDGGETAVFGERLGVAYRAYARADSPAARALADEEERLLAAPVPPEER